MPRELQIRSNSISLLVIRHNHPRPYLLLRRAPVHLNGQWCQIAGGVESGETAWQAAIRELREETGLEPVTLFSADFMEQFYRPDWDALVLAPLFVAFVPAGSEPRLNAEHSEYRWCSRDEALEILPFVSQRACVTHVHAQFVERIPNALSEIPRA